VTDVSGILLAGGSSRRFPPNKLLVEYQGQPLFWHPLRSLASVCTEVIVVVRPDLAPPLPKVPTAVRVIRDAIADEGPLVALRAGLDDARCEWALAVGGDMPRVPAELLRAMIDRASRTEADALALVAEGRPWPMPAMFRVRAARSLVARLVDDGERRLRAPLDGLRVEELSEEWWAERDRAAAWRRDVDRPADLRS